MLIQQLYSYNYSPRLLNKLEGQFLARLDKKVMSCPLMQSTTKSLRV